MENSRHKFVLYSGLKRAGDSLAGGSAAPGSTDDGLCAPPLLIDAFELLGCGKGLSRNSSSSDVGDAVAVSVLSRFSDAAEALCELRSKLLRSRAARCWCWWWWWGCGCTGWNGEWTRGNGDPERLL